MLAAAFQEPRERARAIGIWAGVSGLGLAIGPFAGGLLVKIGDWPAIFFVNLPIGILVLALSVPKLSESRNPNALHIDLPGQILVTGGLICLVMALIEGSSAGWTSLLIVGLLIGAAVCILAFLLVEARGREPMIPLSLFMNPVFSIANIASLVLGFAMMGTLFFFVQFLQNVQGYTAFGAGLRMLPTSVGIFAVGPFAGRLTARIGPRPPIVLGALLSAASLFLIATTLQPDTSYAMFWWQITLFGVGLGFMFAPLTTAVLSATPQERSGLGSSMLNTARQVGITLGVAALGAFVAQQFPKNITSQLIQRGISASASITVAKKFALAGAAAANQISQQEHLPLPSAALHQAISQAFVDALHGTFLISAIGLFAAALLTAFLLRTVQPTNKMHVEATDSRKANKSLSTQSAVEEEASR